jgi:putative membrane protein
MLLDKKITLWYLLVRVIYDVLAVTAIAIVSLFVSVNYEQLLLQMPLTIPAFIGTGISILISFKFNQSYDRWWEARKIWGSIVNDSRSFVIQLNTFAGSAGDEKIRKIAYRQIAWCYALGRSLRGLNPLDDTSGLLSSEDVATVKQHRNVPLALLQLHSHDINAMKLSGQIDIFSQIHLDNTLTRLCEAQGKSERIKSTVFPPTFRMFLHFMIYMFVITLSMSIRNVGSGEIILLLLISAPFFILEKSASLMQDPFENRPSDTAVTAIARTIEINIRQLLKETDVPSPQQPEKFFLT